MLEAARHPHKLRLGHLRGNRFEVVLTGTASDDDVAALRARFDALRPRTASPTATASSASGRTRPTPRAAWPCCAASVSERDKRKRKLMLSALQSAVFNRALELRATRGLAHRRHCLVTC